MTNPQGPQSPGSMFDTNLSSTPLPPLPPIPVDNQDQQQTYGMAYDSMLAPPSLPTRPATPSMPPPGSAYDTSLTSTPLPQRSPMPPPPPEPHAWNAFEKPAPPPEPWNTTTSQEQVVTWNPPQQRVTDQAAQQAVVFESAVRAEIKQLESYFTRQMQRFRLFGVGTVVCAALVPVLIAAGAWSWLAAAMGAIAAVSGSLQTLYRYQDSALSAMTLANSLEAELVRYQTGTTPYMPGSPGNFNLFVDRTTKLRGDATASFNGVWNSAQVSTSGA
ncbi:MAG TPA: DUF4231 domain-containing protein [Candidatus Limnocylindrales bacterium]